MKNSRGISVLALVITVIVMIIITSITVYNGVTVIADARKKDATDKLSTICSSLRKDDSFLAFVSGETILTEQDYMALDLREFYDEDYPVLLTKNFSDTKTSKVTTYRLDMYDSSEMTDVYTSQEFSIEKSLEKNVYEATFDELRGVNRPILFDNMHALTTDMSALVEDVYEDTWYNYNPSAPSFAKMKYDTNGDGSIEDETITYAWIPRFAYSIQEYYDGLNNPLRPFTKVPSTAIKIVFLRENSNYMINNETLPSGYIIHPAFRSADTEKPGIWVAIDSSINETTFSSAVSICSNIVGTNADLSSHLMTNSEFSAALYLMYAFNCLDEIDFTKYDEYVAAGSANNSTLKSLEFADLYAKDADSDTGIVDKNGDAMTETNWDRYTGIFPVSQSNIVVRLLESGYFNFDVASTSELNHYRSVIVTR
ncbi:MAG: hypothetical protein IJX99_04015 [Clostridia bacterium]|nr:hypothetical protein [Clostridia bacterium]